MRRAQFDLVRSGLGTGILVVALCFQMLPFFLLLTVMAHTMGVSGGGMLVIIPILLFAMLFAVCWLVSKRTQRVPDWPPPRKRRTINRRVRGAVALLRTRAEHYQELRDILGRVWR